MGDGKALQMGTSHELGQNFAKAFDINYSSAEGGQEYAWTTSWGTSTRMVGGLIMCHGDDNGLRVPPRLAPIQAYVMVVKDGDGVAEAAAKLRDALRDAGVRVALDDRIDTPFGRRAVDAELQGLPGPHRGRPARPGRRQRGRGPAYRRLEDARRRSPTWSPRCSPRSTPTSRRCTTRRWRTGESRTVEVATLDEAIEAAATAGPGCRGRRSASTARPRRTAPGVTVRCLRPRRRLGAGLRGRAGPGRLPRPLVLMCQDGTASRRPLAGTGPLLTPAAAACVRTRSADHAPQRAARPDRLGPAGPGGPRRRPGPAALGRPAARRWRIGSTEAGLGIRAMPFAEWVHLAVPAARGAAGTAAGAEVPARRGGPLGLVVPRRRRPLRPLVRQPGGARRPLGRRHRSPASTRSTRIWTSWSRPDRSWGWKDEDEFAERLAFPDHYWVTDEAAVRAEGERVVELVEAGEFPFDGTWCDFTPTAGVAACRDGLPPGWDRPPVAADRGALSRHLPAPTRVTCVRVRCESSGAGSGRMVGWYPARVRRPLTRARRQSTEQLRPKPHGAGRRSPVHRPSGR